MLVDLPDGWERNPDHRLAEVFKELGYPEPVRYGQGLYGDLFSDWLDDLIENEHPFDPLYVKGTWEERMAVMVRHITEDRPHDYGVCDYPEQVIERWPEIASDPRPFFILFRLYRKSEEQERGLRWHKCGKYIGTLEPQCEYLKDEPVIKQVYLFSVYQMKENING